MFNSYFFSGQEMIGKRTFVLELAALATGKFRTHDVLYIGTENSDSGRSISIDEIRRLKNFAVLSPMGPNYKFAIINDAHLMTEEAQNALLKILEEPNRQVIMILISSNPDNILSTVSSRCQEMRFPSHRTGVISNLVNSLNLSEDRKRLLITLANGRVGLVKQAMVESNLMAEVEKSVKELLALTRADLETKLSYAQKLGDEKNRALLSRKVMYWLLFARTKTADPKGYQILRNLQILNKVINQPQYNTRLALENFMLNI